MKQISLLSLAVIAAACSGGEARNTDLAASGSTPNVNNDRPAANAPAKANPAPVRPAAARTTTVSSGTSVHSTMSQQLHSRTTAPNSEFKASVASDVKDASGRVAIPAGSQVTMRIVKLEPASQNVGQNGRLELAVVSVNVRGREVPISGTVGSVPHTFEGRGITKDEAARVAGGAAVGAVIGQVIGKNTKSTVIGGAVGTAAGAAVAVKYAMKDIVIAAGAPFTITLNAPVTVALN
jgi:hypothetical protein